jgi:hypothetical protein
MKMRMYTEIIIIIKAHNKFWRVFFLRDSIRRNNKWKSNLYAAVAYVFFVALLLLFYIFTNVWVYTFLSRFICHKMLSDNYKLINGD